MFFLIAMGLLRGWKVASHIGADDQQLRGIGASRKGKPLQPSHRPVGVLLLRLVPAGD